MQLEEIKKTTGQRVENGTVSRDKSLAAILAENKNKKEEEFQQMWKTMKQGTYRTHALPKLGQCNVCLALNDLQNACL